MNELLICSTFNSNFIYKYTFNDNKHRLNAVFIQQNTKKHIQTQTIKL